MPQISSVLVTYELPSFLTSEEQKLLSNTSLSRKIPSIGSNKKVKTYNQDSDYINAGTSIPNSYFEILLLLGRFKSISFQQLKRYIKSNSVLFGDLSDDDSKITLALDKLFKKALIQEWTFKPKTTDFRPYTSFTLSTDGMRLLDIFDYLADDITNPNLLLTIDNTNLIKWQRLFDYFNEISNSNSLIKFNTRLKILDSTIAGTRNQYHSNLQLLFSKEGNNELVFVEPLLNAEIEQLERIHNYIYSLSNAVLMLKNKTYNDNKDFASYSAKNIIKAFKGNDLINAKYVINFVVRDEGELKELALFLMKKGIPENISIRFSCYENWNKDGFDKSHYSYIEIDGKLGLKRS
jgi:hypothetical protein